MVLFKNTLAFSMQWFCSMKGVVSVTLPQRNGHCCCILLYISDKVLAKHKENTFAL